MFTFIFEGSEIHAVGSSVRPLLGFEYIFFLLGELWQQHRFFLSL
jgi:hypothetical protein